MNTAKQRELHHNPENWEKAKQAAQEQGKLICGKPCTFTADTLGELKTHRDLNQCGQDYRDEDDL